MNNFPMQTLSPEEQQRLMSQMDLLMAKQVKSYHKMHHMGENSSVPVELAQELMESIEYTINLVGGVYTHKNMEEALLLGQEILEGRLAKAKSMLELVNGTAPRWQTECRWEALRYLGHYLERYDHLHLAHRGPEDLFYPILISPPDGIQGLDSCLFFLNILWIENQIMAGVPDDALEQFWDCLPAATLNQCEHLLINGIGKAILYDRSDDLVFTESEKEKLHTILSTQPIGETVHHAAWRLCRQLDLPENAAAYLHAAASQISCRVEIAVTHNNLATIFL